MIRLLYLFTLALCALPFVPGVLGILIPAFSWLPPLGLTTPNLSAFDAVIQWPALTQSLWLTLFTGLGSTGLAVLFCFLILRQYWNSPHWQRVEHSLSPMLAMPHVAFAIGFAFTFAPAGWFFRLFEAIGLDTHGWFSLIKDEYGIGLLLALAIKETPFLLLMSISVLQQIKVNRLTAVASGLGYSHNESWLKVILPQWLPGMRLPIFAVAAYGISVVDVALILGPARPPTFSVLVWQWFNEPELTLLPRAAVGAMVLLGLALLALGLIRLLEWLMLQHCRQWQIDGPRHLSSKAHRRLHQPRAKLRFPSYAPFVLIPILVIPVLVLWSFAHRWRFPDLLPNRYSLRFWQQESLSLVELAANSISLALVSSLCALVLAVACLEYRQQYQRGIPSWLIALPMVLPQLSLLFGIQITTYLIPGQWYWLWVAWSHLFFVFPYLYLALDGPWRNYDIRLDQSARSLGLNGWQTWWRVKRPLLLPAIWLGLAVGVSVSLAQYLPTQMLGAGRISTLTTEAVALASGQDRRVSAIYGLLQGVLPFLFFTLAIAASRYSARYTRRTQQQRRERPDDIICGKPHYK
ncbi:ABC transporter permease [Photobacterium alginatilyticum]|uniref:Thiamine ABC transporter permease n=1 Tax=Photobacterium alginatilyticum TaxID=1775171 RepID=A0ABW9YC85_9GAMM|nr:thiamine ABC transporter permease [Photobacterium alginatilyticum]NBI51337.1 thiamine ABC transporter permease [Photobacterium alginatilyticum]